MIDELERRIGMAKAVIDNGFCRVGPRLDRADAQGAALTGGASRALGLADALVGLCRRDHPAEAAVLLRQLADVAAEVAWVAADAARAPEALAALAAPRWDALFDDARFKARAAAAGFPEADVSGVTGLAADFAAGNRQVAPWSHVYAENTRPAPDPARVMALAARMMGRVLKALEARWPGTFPGSEELCSS
ncbi:hypothetical protein EPO15_09515 [bacterium]|nr:MAG: hypothetical protein EPO15_09515 [bacterium]